MDAARPRTAPPAGPAAASRRAAAAPAPRGRNRARRRWCRRSWPASDPDALEEMLAAARDAEQLRQLRHRDGQRRSGLEAEQDRLADEVDQRAQPQHPRQHAHRRHDQRGQRRDVRPARRIALGHAGDGRARPASRSPRSGRRRAGATCRTARRTARRAGSSRCRTAAAARPARRTPAKPGWRRRRGSRPRPRRAAAMRRGRRAATAPEGTPRASRWRVRTGSVRAPRRSLAVRSSETCGPTQNIAIVPRAMPARQERCNRPLGGPSTPFDALRRWRACSLRSMGRNPTKVGFAPGNRWVRFDKTDKRGSHAIETSTDGSAGQRDAARPRRPPTRRTANRRAASSSARSTRRSSHGCTSSSSSCRSG